MAASVEATNGPENEAPAAAPPATPRRITLRYASPRIAELDLGNLSSLARRVLESPVHLEGPHPLTDEIVAELREGLEAQDLEVLRQALGEVYRYEDKMELEGVLAPNLAPEPSAAERAERLAKKLEWVGLPHHRKVLQRLPEEHQAALQAGTPAAQWSAVAAFEQELLKDKYNRAVQALGEDPKLAAAVEPADLLWIEQTPETVQPRDRRRMLGALNRILGLLHEQRKAAAAETASSDRRRKPAQRGRRPKGRKMPLSPEDLNVLEAQRWEAWCLLEEQGKTLPASIAAVVSESLTTLNPQDPEAVSRAYRSVAYLECVVGLRKPKTVKVRPERPAQAPKSATGSSGKSRREAYSASGSSAVVEAPGLKAMTHQPFPAALAELTSQV